ncbi:hypothetical protein BCV71DRAFT_265213 [Rhizopus microsporus]|uniref:SAM domain-containing protein n=1 Tax=Rhizopus microsporus TaxID=58291 RepID=A0A1X0RXZ2_RHIZD|nr:hypothetical protein BCV71DRAFT_265213 [Rhizopus microsporus]
MSMLLLETLKKAELDQYYSSFSANGITQLESLAQLSLQEYSSLGITSVADRKKLFHLVQSLRQETPSLENGLVSSSLKPLSYKHRSPSTNNVDTVRRGSAAQIIQSPIPTRTRSRTLPSFEKPDFISDRGEEAVEESDEDEEKCEIRRGSNPLLDPYGVPIKSRYQQKSSPLVVSSQPSDLNQKIRVCVRKRPLNKKEIERGEKDIAPTCGMRSINVHEPK